MSSAPAAPAAPIDPSGGEAHAREIEGGRRSALGTSRASLRALPNGERSGFEHPGRHGVRRERPASVGGSMGRDELVARRVG